MISFLTNLFSYFLFCWKWNKNHFQNFSILRLTFYSNPSAIFSETKENKNVSSKNKLWRKFKWIKWIHDRKVKLHKIYHANFWKNATKLASNLNCEIKNWRKTTKKSDSVSNKDWKLPNHVATDSRTRGLVSFSKIEYWFCSFTSTTKKRKSETCWFSSCIRNPWPSEKKEDKTNHGKRVSYCLASVGIGNV